MNENQTPNRIVCFMIVALALSVGLAMHAKAETVVWSPCGTGIEYAMRAPDDPIYGVPELGFAPQNVPNGGWWDHFFDMEIDLLWWMRK